MSTSLQVLNAEARLRLNEGACLPLRSDFGRCRACASACPAQVLAVTVERVTLADGCLHCGRCAAACPTGALQFEGLGFEVDPPQGAAPVELECAKVPSAARSGPSVTVPCLGGLSVGRLAALHEAAGERGVSLVERGWCGQCAAGCGNGAGAPHPAADALMHLALLLETAGDPRPAPALVSRPLPRAQMPDAIPLPAPEGPAMSRRQFFRSMASDPVGARRATPMGGNGRAAFPAAARQESPERRRLLDALGAAAARVGRELPPEVLPSLTVHGHCADHRVCVAACPTGALQVTPNAQGADLSLAATRCLACGACVRACPEHALALELHGGSVATAVIASHARRTCAACGDDFTPRDSEELCLACAKSRRFMGDAMAQMFGTRN